MSETFNAIDRECMTRAIASASQVRCATSPNPWVGRRGARRRRSDLRRRHPEVGRDARRGRRARRCRRAAPVAAPCTSRSSRARTTAAPRPCADALIDAGVARVVVALEDPDPQVAGRGIDRLPRRRASTVEVGLLRRSRSRHQLAPYLKHRRTGRPWVVLKLGVTLDGAHRRPRRLQPVDHRRRGPGRRPPPAGRERRHRRRRRHRPRRRPVAHRARLPPPCPTAGRPAAGRARARHPPGAKVHPCREMSGDLDRPARRARRPTACLQVLVEGGATVAGDFHRAGLVDRYVIYLAPALFGGDDARRPVRRARRRPRIGDARGAAGSDPSIRAPRRRLVPHRADVPHRRRPGPGGADVHRHRRRTRHRRVPRRAPLRIGADRRCSTTSSSARRSPSTAAA